MRFYCRHTFDRQDRSHRNNDEEEKFFEWNIKWAIDTQHAIAIKEPMSLGDCICIPNQKESTNWKDTDERSLPAAQDSGLEKNLEPE